MTKKDLSEERIRELEVAACDWGLVDGENFDGTIFRDAFGTPLRHHPSWINRS